MVEVTGSGRGMPLGWRIAAWGGAASLLLAAAIGELTMEEFAWDVNDFVLFGGLLTGACMAFELAGRQAPGFAHKAGTALAIGGGLFLFIACGAVGVIGHEGNPANLLFGLVLATGLIGALAARFRPRGMALTLLVMAGIQAAIAAAAVIFRLGTEAPNWPLDVLGANCLFVTIWLVAALLFRHAARAAPATK